MTVNATDPIIRYPYTGIGNYSFPFVIFKKSDIQIVYTDVDGLTSVLIYGTDYFVELDPQIDGGVCNLLLDETDGYIDIRRVLPIIQETEWLNNDPFDAELLENDLDRIIMILQQMELITEIGSAVTNWQGDWVTGFNYAIKDFIKGPNTNLYTCMAAHTAGVFASDLAVGYWQLVLDVEAVELARLDAEASAEEARLSAEDSADFATESQLHAADSALSAAQAAASEANAAISETNAANCAEDAADSAIDLDEAVTEAYHWANMGEDIAVPESLTPPQYSAYHWSKKAEGVAGGGISSLTGITPVIVNDISAIAKSVELESENARFVPLGGTADQHLAKVDGVDRNLAWVDPPVIPDFGGLLWENVAISTAAVAGIGYMMDTSGAVRTLTLPAVPSEGDEIGVSDLAGTFSTNSLTIARNGNNIMGVAADKVLTNSNQTMILVYADATQGWKIVLNSVDSLPGVQSFMQVQDQKTTGTHGGTSSAGMNDRTLNTLLINDISGASLASNLITLPAGTYDIFAESAYNPGEANDIGLVMVRSSADVILLKGLAETKRAGEYAAHNGIARGRVVLAAPTDIKITCYCTYGFNSVGLGEAAGVAPHEIYTNITITKV